MIPDQKYLDLAEKWKNGSITPEEERVFSEWYNAGQDEEIIIPDTFAASEEAHGARMFEAIRQRRAGLNRPRAGRWVAAAAVVLLVASGATLWGISRRTDPLKPVAKASEVIRPVGNKAFLTLGDGSVVDLDTARDGVLAENGKTKIDKQAAHLVYDGEAQGPDTVYNTLSTPKGGIYMVTLSDGSKVWLNASSALRYPTQFRGATREVELTGEAYFEVAAAPSQPFKVKVDGMTVDVLGTHFDVMAYGDEPSITTTLLQGSVQIGMNDHHLMLTPGQQSTVARATGQIAARGVDVDEAIAWKNGVFQFNSEDIQSVMRKVARWYDVDVRYEGTVGQHFTGSAPRDADLATLLRRMELTNEVKFQVTGKTVTVTP